MAAPWMPREMPRDVRYGIDIDPWWQVDIATLPDGRESPNLLWSQARHNYTLSVHTDSPETYMLAKGHFMQARGRLAHWPFKDPMDHAATHADGVVVAAPGGYRLAKRYGEGSDPHLRTISRPVGVVVHQLGAPAVGITINASTGYLVGVSGSPALSEFTWAGEFRVPVRYDIERFPSRVTNRKRDGDYWVEVDGIQIVEVRE